MTLPLQPMSTAPRDGREVLAVMTGGYWSYRVVRYSYWHKDYPWRSEDYYSNDDAFSGWLDIDEMVRDSARLDHVLRNQGQCELQPQPWIKDVFDETCETCPKNITEWEQAWLAKARAAIDKEMGRADRQQRHAAKRDEIARRT